MAQTSSTINSCFLAFVGLSGFYRPTCPFSHLPKTHLPVAWAFLHSQKASLPPLQRKRSHQIRNPSNFCHGTYRLNLQAHSCLLFLPFKIRRRPSSSSKVSTFTCAQDPISVPHNPPPFLSTPPFILAQSQQCMCAFTPLLLKQHHLDPIFLPSTWYSSMNCR